MNQEELLSFYRKELKRSKNWRTNKEQNYDDAWRRFVNLYEGKHYDRLPGTDQLTVNMVFATINVMAPAVAINNPRFTVNARKPESAGNAIMTEEILNYMWRAHSYQSEFRLAVLDWLILGHGWVKVGYKFVKPPEAKPADVELGNSDSTEEAATQEGIDDRDPIPGNVESEVYQTDDRPFVERISPFDIFVDPDARHPKEMRWIAQRTWRAVQDVHVDSRYSATQRKRVTGRSRSKWDNDNGDARNEGDAPDKGSLMYAEIIEFYDLKRRTVCTFSTEGSQESAEQAGFLIKAEPMPYALGCPFVMLRNFEVPDHFYPIGDVQQIESLQLELNETRNQMLNYRKKFRRAYIAAKDILGRDGLAALESEVDNVVIPVEGDHDLSKVIVPVPINITPPEFFDQSAMISADLDRVSGVSDYQRGNPQQNIKRTATEAAMIQDAANARAQDRLAKIENILSQVGERIIGLMQQYMTGEHVARIVTIPVRGWFNYNAEYIKGQFDFDVQAGSTEPQNETFRRQSALQIVDASMPFIEAGIVNMPALYQELLSKGFGIKDAHRFIQIPPPPPGPGMPMGPNGLPQPGAAGMPPEGAPPMDPMMGGQPPMDPMAGQMPPMDPAMMGGMPPELQGAALTPEMLMAMMQQGSPQPV